MTAQQSVVDAPELPEAEDNVVYISRLSDPTPALVHGYPDAKTGDVIKIAAYTSTLNFFEEKKVLTTPVFPVQFGIPKSIFAENLEAGAQAKLHFTVTNAAGNVIVSSPLKVSIER